MITQKMSYSENAFSLKRNERKIFRYVLGITAFNVILFFIAGTTNANTHNAGEGPSLWTQLFLMMIGIVVGGFLCGLLVSLIPFRRLSYSEKYLRSSLIVIFVLSLAFLILIVRSLIVFSSFS
jgi:hypothetical protein